MPVSFNPLESGSTFKLDSKTFKIQEDLTNFSSNLSNDSTNNPSKYSLLVPKGKNNLKISKGLKINRFYNIGESVSIPDIQYGKVVKKRKDVRVVKGLKPQHFATGYDRTELDVTSDVEDENNNDDLKVDQDGDVELQDIEIKKEKKEKKDKKEKKEKKDKKSKKDKKEKK